MLLGAQVWNMAVNEGPGVRQNSVPTGLPQGGDCDLEVVRQAESGCLSEPGARAAVPLLLWATPLSC